MARGAGTRGRAGDAGGGGSHAPSLNWRGKGNGGGRGTTSGTTRRDALGLRTLECIDPKEVLRKLSRPIQGKGVQKDLLGRVTSRFDGTTTSNKFSGDWTNRAILGDSLSAMDALSSDLSIAGKVQVVYFDPPYGIGLAKSYRGSIKAYRDAWRDGIHTYLTYLRERLAVARDLMSESGSIFVQINAEKVHYLRILLDEVFGAENFVALIPYRSGTSQRARHIGSVYDYLVWFAKDKQRVKYHRLYLPRDFRQRTSTFDWVELPDGTFRKLTGAERANPSLLPRGRLVKLAQLKFKKPAQLEKLRKAGRVHKLREREYGKRYEDDFPLVPLLNAWHDTVKSTFAGDKQYVVETNPKVVERCLLMTSDPGDLVLDPTCGSGTTAIVAEKWGRRWVTCDVSPVATLLLRTRLVTRVFPAYTTVDPGGSLERGYDYETVEHVTLGNVANGTAPRKEVLYDRPRVDGKKRRLASVFRVESISRDPRTTNAGEFRATCVELLGSTGVTFPGGKRLEFTRVGGLDGGTLHAEGEFSLAGGTAVRAAFYIGDPMSVLGGDDVEAAVEAVAAAAVPGGAYDALFVLGEYFAPGACDAARAASGTNRGALTVDMVHVSPDIHMHRYLKVTPSTSTFHATGTPRVKLAFDEPGGDGRPGGGDRLARLELEGILARDPTDWEERLFLDGHVAAWMADLNYDGGVLAPDLVHVLGERRSWKRTHRHLKNVVDPDKLALCSGTTSNAYPVPPGSKVAVMVFDYRGNPATTVLKVPAATSTRGTTPRPATR
ncbi:MAG: site-specific DNA-methyltransferase [Promethearchaeota archaeon]